MVGSSSTPDAEQPLIGSPKLREMYTQSWGNGEGYLAEQVVDLDVPDSYKVNLMHMHKAVGGKDADIVYYRRMTTGLFVLQAVAGAIVPILIPFGQTYDREEKVLFGVKINNLGETLLVIAVCCSLLGSIAMVIERAGKFSKLAFAYNSEQERKYCAITRFLALGGKYQQYSTHKEAYPVFVDDYCSIFESNSRAKIFGGTIGDGHDDSQGDGDGGSKNEKKDAKEESQNAGK